MRGICLREGRQSSLAAFRVAAWDKLFGQSRNGIGCELRGVRRSRGQAADLLHDVLTPDPCRFRDRLCLHQLSCRRSACHSGNAAFGLKANLGDSPVQQPGGQPEHVPADRVFDLHGRVGIVDDAGISWVFEMIEQLGGVHQPILFCNTHPMGNVPLRIVSLQPSVTVILRELGCLDALVGCTRYCAELCPEVIERKIARVADSWTAQAEQISSLRPDLVIASVPYQEKSVAEIMKAGARFLGFAPKTLGDVYGDIMVVAGLMNVSDRAAAVVERMQKAIDEVQSKTRELPKVSVFCEEWGKPLIASQPWVQELVVAAGGEFIGTPGAQVLPEEIAARRPEVWIAAWCGAGDRVPLAKIVEQRGWHEIPATKNRRVYSIRDDYLNTPAPSLLLGLRALAAAIHPRHFPQAEGLRSIEENRVIS